VYLPLYFQVVHKLSVSEAGFALIPLSVMTTPGSMLSGRSMMYLRHYKWSSVIGASIAIASVFALVLWPAMPLYGVIAMLVLIGFGAGTVYPVATVAIQNAAPPRHLGTATGTINFFRALASTLGVAIMGAILLGHLGATVQRGGIGIEVLTQASAGSFDMAGMFRWVFAAAAIFLALALAAILLMEERPLRGPASARAPAQAPTAPAE
jgi:MFS family permease